MPDTMGVLNIPGAIVFTLTPILANYLAKGSVIPTMPAFEAEYAA